MTRGEIYNAVRYLAQRPTLPMAQFNYYLQVAEGELNSLLHDHPKSQVAATLLKTVDQETGEYTPLIPLPDDLLQLVLLKQGDTVYPQYPSGEDVAPSLGYIDRGTCLEIFPTPVADTAYTLLYFRALDPLTANDQSNWVSTYYPNVYVYGVLRELGTALEHPRRAEWAEEFARRVSLVTRQGWDQNVSLVQARERQR